MVTCARLVLFCILRAYHRHPPIVALRVSELPDTLSRGALQHLSILYKIESWLAGVLVSTCTGRSL